MNIIHVRIPHLPVQVEQRKHGPEASPRGLIIGGRPWDPSVVLDCCATAEASGVTPGIPLARAALRCPDADFVTADHVAYREAQEEMMAALHQFTDLVETYGLGLFFIEVAPLARRYPEDAALADAMITAIREVTGFDLQLGLAEARFTAEQAALAARRNHAMVVPAGRGRYFLSSLALTALPAEAEILRRLDLLGIRTLGELAALPRAAVMRQFGTQAGFLHDLAAGVDARPVLPDAPPLELRHQRTFEPPVADQPTLVAATHRMVSALAETLHRQGYQAQGLRIELTDTVERRHTTTTSVEPPTSDPARLDLRSQSLLERIGLEHPVETLEIVIYPLRPTYLGATQLALFPASRDQRRRSLHEALRRLRARFGEAIVRIASLVHPPEPCPIDVRTTERGLPTIFVWDERTYRVIRIYEHWRERRFWWARPVARDYYRLEDCGGHVRLIYLDLTTHAWRLDRRKMI